MSLNVGELVAGLRLDDAQFTRGLTDAEQGMRRLDTVAGQMATSVRDAGRDAGRALDTVADGAQRAGRELEQIGTSAQQASRHARDIEIPSSLITDAQRAAREVAQIGQAAGQAAGQLQGAAGQLGQAGSAGGHSAAGGFLSGFSNGIGNLASRTGPIAGSLIGIAEIGISAGIALVSAIKDGMDQELKRDLFQAQTGVTEAQARKFGLAAAESYSDAFGESIEGNLNTVKAALANGLLDPGSTQRDAEQMINSIDGVAAILGEDIPAVARAAGKALQTGFADDAQDAFDLFVKGSQMGLNVSEDFLDTVIEYGTQFRKIGIDGAEAIGLMSQMVKNGARDTDVAADALKEFSIRAVDGSTTSAEAFESLGMNAQEMTARFAAGGDSARTAFRELVIQLRQVEDPVARNTIAVGLFGTQAEDLGAALGAMDLDSATQSMLDYEGAAKRAIDVMGGNAATSVEGAMRSLETIGDGLKASLAEAFGPQIQRFADTISNNRSGVISFFQGLMNGAFDGAEAVLRFSAGALDAFSNVADAGTTMVVGILRGLASLAKGFDAAKGFLAVLNPSMLLDDIGGGMSETLTNLADGLDTVGHGAADGMRVTAETIRNDVIPAIDEAQVRANQSVDAMRLSASYNDASAKVNATISGLGETADGATIQIENWTGAIDRANTYQVQMEDSLRGMVGQFQDQVRTGMEAGETVESLTGQYDANRVALLDQLVATGMNREAADAYITSLGLIPNLVETQINQPGMPEAHYAMDVLKGKVLETPDEKTIKTSALTQDAIDDLRHLGLTVTENTRDGTVTVTADTAAAEAAMVEWRKRNSWLKVTPEITGLGQNMNSWTQSSAPRADGGVDLPDQATIATGGRTLYQWNEPETGGEGFIPLSPAKRRRSLAIWAEIGRRFGVLRAMADGGVLDSFIAIQQQVAPELTMTSGVRNEPGSYHNTGQAGDFSNGSGNTDEQLRFAQYMADNYASQLAELIYDDPRFAGREVKNGQFVDASFYDAAGDHTNHVHVASLHPLAVVAGAGQMAANNAGPDSRSSKQRNVDTVIAEGKRMGMSDKQIRAAVMTILAEADGEDLPYGDRDSEGAFQQRPSQGWGPASEDLATDARQFYERLREVPGQEAMTEAQMAQAVQRSSSEDGSIYAARAAEANQLIAASNGAGSSSNYPADYTSSSGSSGSSAQQVFVVNWPPALGGGDRQPIAQFTGKLFAQGGIEDHSPQISNALRIWGEPETGGEAYIPLSPSKRAASLALWAEVGRRLGVAAYAAGGFGGYTGPDTTDYMKPRNAYDAVALGAGLLFTAASGLSGVASMAGSGTVNLGELAPTFDTSANSIPGLDKAFAEFTRILEEVRDTLQKGGMIDANIDVDSNTGAANVAIQRVGIA